jgi:hypothetical protein
MSLVLLGDPRLYTDHAYYREHFRWQTAGAPTGRVVHHLFWSGVFIKHHELCLKSLLLTQSEPWEVWLWMPPETIARNAAFLECLTHLPIVIKPYVPQQEARDTPFERAMQLLIGASPQHISDGLRLLALWKYGGLYTDIDVLFLRDIRPLLAVELCYQWSFHSWASNSIFNFRHGSAALEALVERCVRIGSTRSRRSMALEDLRDLPGELHLLPCFVFDPVWIATDSVQVDNPYLNHFNEFFESTMLVDFNRFFPESYAFQWHNRWTREIAPGRVAGQLYEQVNRRFRALCEHRRWNDAGDEWCSVSSLSV